MLSASSTEPLQFGQALKEMRMKARLTQRELAESLGISAAIIGRYEKGNVTPSDKTLFAINRFFEQLHGETMTDNTALVSSLSGHSLDNLLTEIRQRGFKVSIESV
jgi:transcriptional regulator with XRE-family HTH domain